MNSKALGVSSLRGRTRSDRKLVYRAAFIVSLLAALPARTTMAGPQATLSPSSHTIEVNGGRLHYLMLGSGGTPLIVINGGPGFDHHVMMPTSAWTQLARFREVVLYDQRGTGKSTSERSTRRITVRALVDDLDALRRALRADKVNLLGWSWGGYLAMAYATQHSQKISHLVLVDPGPPNLRDNIYLFKDLFPDVVARQRPSTTPAGKTGCESTYIPDYLYMEFYDPARRDAFLKSGPFPFSETMCTEALLDAMRHDLTDEVRHLPIRTLVISGRFDANVAPIVSLRISKLIPGAQFKVFDRSGHMPFIEQPREFADAVQSFLGGTGMPAKGHQ